jgi:hypothetical protein
MAGKRWNGSSYVDVSTKKRWNGSSWINLTTAKRWNGSSWIDIFPASTLTFATSDGVFSEIYSCDGSGCELNKTVSDTDTYTISGGTSPYTVTAVLQSGAQVTIDTATAGQITLTTTVGRNIVKEGEIKVTVTDSAGTPNTADFYVPYYFEYAFTIDGQGPPFEPEYPPPEPF